jgi:hypothetical protein
LLLGLQARPQASPAGLHDFGKAMPQVNASILAVERMDFVPPAIFAAKMLTRSGGTF